MRGGVVEGSRCTGSALLRARAWRAAWPTSLAIALAALSALAVGCARQDREPPLPLACSAGPEEVQAALEAAPRPVRVDGTPLSACIDARSDAADLQTVGSSLVAVAAELGGQAARRPEGRAAVQLGYLVGAMQRGAGRANAQGINSELMRRVELELDPVGPGSRAVDEGIRAGRRTG